MDNAKVDRLAFSTKDAKPRIKEMAELTEEGSVLENKIEDLKSALQCEFYGSLSVGGSNIHLGSDLHEKSTIIIIDLYKNEIKVAQKRLEEN